MKVLVIIIIIIVAVAGAAYLLDLLPRAQPPVSPLPVPPPATGSPAPEPGPITVPAPVSPPAAVPSPVPPPPPATGAVAFYFVITDISGSGLSRTVTAQVVNTGTADAHNVWAEVAVSSGGSSINVSGQESLRVDIGALPSGQTVTRQVILSFGFSDGMKIAQNGAAFIMTIHSDEVTEVFPYDYKP